MRRILLLDTNVILNPIDIWIQPFDDSAISNSALRQSKADWPLCVAENMPYQSLFYEIFSHQHHKVEKQFIFCNLKSLDKFLHWKHLKKLWFWRKKNLGLTQNTDKKVIWHRFSRISTIFIPVCLSFGDHRKKRRCPPVVIVMARQQAAAKQRPALPLRSSYYTNIVIALWHFAPYHPLHRNSMLR